MTRQCAYFQTYQAMAGVRSHVRRSVAYEHVNEYTLILLFSCIAFSQSVEMMNHMPQQVHGHDFSALAVLLGCDAYAAASEEKVSRPGLHVPSGSA
jgi:hypothetical protein